MARTQQTFVNDRDGPIYVSVEIWPECFELESGDSLTLIWHAPEEGDAARVCFINAQELVVWPDGDLDRMKFLVNGYPGRHLSWKFKHREVPTDDATR